jgi:hypothetical protein
MVRRGKEDGHLYMMKKFRRRKTYLAYTGLSIREAVSPIPERDNWGTGKESRTGT